MRDLSRPFASTENVPPAGAAPGFVVVTRSVRTTSGQASFTRSARRSGAAGSSAARAERVSPRMESPKRDRGSHMPQRLYRIQPRRAARGPPRGNEEGERHDREPESVREQDEVHMQ